jgi:hypothetical protein
MRGHANLLGREIDPLLSLGARSFSKLVYFLKYDGPELLLDCEGEDLALFDRKVEIGRHGASRKGS